MSRSAPGERAQHARESWAHNDDEESNGTESAATAAAAQSGAAAASHATLAVRDEMKPVPRPQPLHAPLYLMSSSANTKVMRTNQTTIKKEPLKTRGGLKQFWGKST